jgi:hypothetical protein
MHSGFLGIVRKFLNLWFDSEYSNEAFYLGLNKRLLNDKISNLRPPSYFYRYPRDFNNIKQWKSIEYELFAYYYFLCIFRGYLNSKYFNHFAKFVYSISKLNKKNITNDDIKQAKCELFDVVTSINDLYKGIDKLNLYNCHVILHYPESVKNLGPLKSHSAYCSEEQMGYIKSLFKCYNFIPQQILSKFSLKASNNLFFVNNNLLSKMSHKEIMFYESFNNNFIKKYVNKGLGKPNYSHLTDSQIDAINCLDITLNPDLLYKFYKRCFINGYIVSTDSYDNKKNCCDSYISCNINSRKKIVESFFKVKFIVEINGKIYCFCNQIILKLNKKLIVANLTFDYILKVESISDKIVCINCENIKRTVMFIESGEEKHVNSFIINPIVSSL